VQALQPPAAVAELREMAVVLLMLCEVSIVMIRLGGS
jgi:hypothetical protein